MLVTYKTKKLLKIFIYLSGIILGIILLNYNQRFYYFIANILSKDEVVLVAPHSLPFILFGVGVFCIPFGVLFYLEKKIYTTNKYGNKVYHRKHLLFFKKIKIQPLIFSAIGVLFCLVGLTNSYQFTNTGIYFTNTFNVIKPPFTAYTDIHSYTAIAYVSPRRGGGRNTTPCRLNYEVLLIPKGRSNTVTISSNTLNGHTMYDVMILLSSKNIPYYLDYKNDCKEAVPRESLERDVEYFFGVQL